MYKFVIIKPMKKASNGFTIIEILVTITIIGILATIGIVSFSSIQSGSRNTQRSSKITVIAEALEKYYSQNGEYPTCSNGQLVSGATTGTTNVLVVDPNALITPSGNSIVCNAPTSDTFGYVGGGSSYTLEYKDESTGSNVLLNSRHTILTLTAPSAPVTTVSFSSPNVLAAITPVTCQTGAIAQYQINSRTNDGAWAGWSDWSTTAPTASQTANQGVKYGYQAQARCYPNGSSNYTSTTATGTESTYIQAIGAPSAPVVSANTAGATTTWSWPAVTCASGTTARYQYHYTITPAGFDSGWVANGTNLSVAFTTSTQGQNYTVAVQAQCYNTYATSSWSTSGSASYYVTVNTPSSAPTTTVTLSSPNVLATITPVTCSAGSPQYQINSRTNGGSWAGWTAWSTTTTATQTANDGVKYGYQSQARCYVDASNYSAAATGSEGTYIDPIDAPSAPTVAADTVGATTTFSWDVAPCASGTTARYQYRYTISPSGYDSGWVATAASPFAATTSTEGYTYTVQVQAQCYNANTTSGWSGIGQASYYRPLIPLTAIAAISGATTVGSVLTAGALTPSGATVTYQWRSNTTSGGTYTNISSATANTYTLVMGDLGKYIKVVATATGNYTGTRTSVAFTGDPNWLAVGTQVWAKANLNVGTMVTDVTAQTNNSILEKYCSADLESNCTTNGNGGLYQWNEAMQYVTTNGAQGICPTGSHIPSDNDWKILEMQLGMTQAQADATNFRGTDQGTQLSRPSGTSGLSIPLGGYRYTAGSSYSLLSSHGFLWSSSESSTSAWYRHTSTGATVDRNTNVKADGYSVRCLRN